DYYIIKCLVDVPANQYINHSKDSGIIGVDLNVDHFAVSNINKIGQLIESFSMKFDIHNKTTGQLNKIIESKAVGLVNYAVDHKKAIVLEKLDTTKSKVKNLYGNINVNRLICQFVYNKMIMGIKRRADKMGVEVYELWFDYTSQIGKIKYLRRLGISIHEAASYVTARRSMGFKEIR